jgi:hypothetical protein
MAISVKTSRFSGIGDVASSDIAPRRMAGTWFVTTPSAAI